MPTVDELLSASVPAEASRVPIEIAHGAGASFEGVPLTPPTPGATPSVPMDISGATVDIEVRTAPETTGAALLAKSTGTVTEIARQAQVDTITINGTTAAAGETFDAIVNGTLYQFTATGGEAPATIATAWAALIDADGDVSASASAGVITITAAAAGKPFTLTVATDADAVTVGAAAVTPSGFVVHFDAADTLALGEGEFWYDVWITTSGGTPYQATPPSTLTITERVTIV